MDDVVNIYGGDDLLGGSAPRSEELRLIERVARRAICTAVLRADRRTMEIAQAIVAFIDEVADPPIRHGGVVPIPLSKR